MQFFTSAIDTLQTLVVALGAGLGVWGVVNLLEGYGSDNPGSVSYTHLKRAFPVLPYSGSAPKGACWFALFTYYLAKRFTSCFSLPAHP